MTFRIENPSIQIYQLSSVIEQQVQVLQSLSEPETLRHILLAYVLRVADVTDTRVAILDFGIILESLSTRALHSLKT